MAIRSGAQRVRYVFVDCRQAGNPLLVGIHQLVETVNDWLRILTDARKRAQRTAAFGDARYVEADLRNRLLRHVRRADETW